MYDLIILILAVNHLTVRLFRLFFGVDFFPVRMFCSHVLIADLVRAFRDFTFLFTSYFSKTFLHRMNP